MSCLDIFVVSRELLPFVMSLVIDSEGKFAVTRAVKTGSSYKRVQSDHFTCILTLTDLPRVKERRGDKQVGLESPEGGRMGDIQNTLK